MVGRRPPRVGPGRFAFGIPLPIFNRVESPWFAVVVADTSLNAGGVVIQKDRIVGLPTVCERPATNKEWRELIVAVLQVLEGGNGAIAGVPIEHAEVPASKAERCLAVVNGFGDVVQDFDNDWIEKPGSRGGVIVHWGPLGLFGLWKRRFNSLHDGMAGSVRAPRPRRQATGSHKRARGCGRRRRVHPQPMWRDTSWRALSTSSCERCLATSHSCRRTDVPVLLPPGTGDLVRSPVLRRARQAREARVGEGITSQCPPPWLLSGEGG